MNTSSRLFVLLVNAMISAILCALMIAAYAAWIAPPRTPRLAVLDLAELYRLKETQVAAELIKPGVSDVERAAVLKRVQAFGAEVTRLIETLPNECACVIVARGALVGRHTELPDLTADVRRRLGL